MQQKSRHVLIFIICLLFILGCTDNKPPADKEASVIKDSASKPGGAATSKHTNSVSATEIKIFLNEPPFSGYGYDILIDGITKIHQPNIPAVAGNNGFSTEEAARKTAELVLYKINNNIMPPGIDVRELDSLGVH